MKFKFGQYELDIDVEKTRAAYSRRALADDECSCEGCRNYRAAALSFPDKVLEFFAALGMDAAEPTEVYVNSPDEDNVKELEYGGFYHLCGEVLAGKSAWTPYNETTMYWNDAETYEVVPGYCISFQERYDLLEKEFPRPAVQMDISFHVPWVL